MTRPWRILVLAALLTAAAASSPPDRFASITGVVRTPEGQPVPYAMVSLDPPGSRRFADAAGRFAFLGVTPGRYVLRARQVGYRPVDTAIVVDGSVTLDLVLGPLTLRLEEIVVSAAATTECHRPGPPDSVADRDAFVLLAQLRTSAERFQLLADSFPFLYDFERTVRELNVGGSVVRRVVDTTRYRSDQRHTYRPGEVVDWGRGAEAGQRVLRPPTLAHFADSVFVWNHCWFAAAAPEGDTLLALGFRPAEAIRGADIEGTVLLETGTFRLRRIEFQLTRIVQALPGAAAYSSVLTFREAYPGLVVPAVIFGATEALPVRGALRRVWSITEEQRFLGLRYVRTGFH